MSRQQAFGKTALTGELLIRTKNAIARNQVRIEYFEHEIDTIKKFCHTYGFNRQCLPTPVRVIELLHSLKHYTGDRELDTVLGWKVLNFVHHQDNQHLTSQWDNTASCWKGGVQALQAELEKNFGAHALTYESERGKPTTAIPVASQAAQPGGKEPSTMHSASSFLNMVPVVNYFRRSKSPQTSHPNTAAMDALSGQTSALGLHAPAAAVPVFRPSTQVPVSVEDSYYADTGRPGTSRPDSELPFHPSARSDNGSFQISLSDADLAAIDDFNNNIRQMIKTEKAEPLRITNDYEYAIDCLAVVLQHCGKHLHMLDSQVRDDRSVFFRTEQSGRSLSKDDVVSMTTHLDALESCKTTTANLRQLLYRLERDFDSRLAIIRRLDNILQDSEHEFEPTTIKDNALAIMQSLYTGLFNSADSACEALESLDERKSEELHSRIRHEIDKARLREDMLAAAQEMRDIVRDFGPAEQQLHAGLRLQRAVGMWFIGTAEVTADVLRQG